MGAQGIVRRAVVRRAAADARGVPGVDALEQTHAALVRDMRQQPGMIEDRVVCRAQACGPGSSVSARPSGAR